MGKIVNLRDRAPSKPQQDRADAGLKLSALVRRASVDALTPGSENVLVQFSTEVEATEFCRLMRAVARR